MSVRVACPACAKPLKIAETLLGKELNCSACQARILAPTIGSCTASEARAYTLLCVGCGAPLTIDEKTVETPVQCSTCGTPVEFADYPELAELRNEIRTEKRARERARKAAEKEARADEKRMAKTKRILDRERARKAELERIANDDELQQELWTQGEPRERKEPETRKAPEEPTPATEEELQENDRRVDRAGGCVRCGSLRLVQKMELRSDFGKVLYGLGIVGVIVGAPAFLLGLIVGDEAVIVGLLSLAPGAALMTLSNHFKIREGECQQCGWRWRT